MQQVIFVLGAADPEMRAIESLLSRSGLPFVHAAVNGTRVYPANAYKAEVSREAVEVLELGGRVYLVECVAHAPAHAIRIDHHHRGDPGYGRAPAEFWQASSIGQTVRALANDLGVPVVVTNKMRMVAAADHCLGAAYQGECPGIDPDALMRWHITSRANYEQRSETAVREDVETTRRLLHEVPRIELAPGLFAADVRGYPVAELLLAAARDGQCCLSAVKARDGRTKIGCLVGSQAQVLAFMQTWAPAHHLVDIYGDSVRGFSGAYVPLT